MEFEEKVYLFSASWCTNCPVVKNEIARKNADVVQLDVDDYGELAASLGIMSVPTILDNRKGAMQLYSGAGKAFNFVQQNF